MPLDVAKKREYGRKYYRENKLRMDEKSKARTANLKAQGLCGRCGKAPVLGKKTCSDCQVKRVESARKYHKVNEVKRREYMRLWKAKKRVSWRAQGLCSQCGKAPVPGKKTCGDCQVRSVGYFRKLSEVSKVAIREDSRLRMAEQYKVHRATEICIACSKAAVPGKVQCSDHLARSVRYGRERRKRRVSQGICIHCVKKPSRVGRQTCMDCGALLCAKSNKANKRKRERTMDIMNRKLADLDQAEIDGIKDLLYSKATVGDLVKVFTEITKTQCPPTLTA